MSRRAGRLLQAAALGLAVALGSGCGQAGPEEGSGVPGPAVVRVAAAALHRVRPSVETYGTIVYHSKADVYPGSEGRVERILVEEGAPVRRGQALAVLSSDRLEAERERIESEVASKTALLALAEERLREGRLAVEARLLAVRKAEAELAGRQAECDNLALVYSNKKQLFAAGGVAEGELENVRTRLLGAEQALAQAASELEIQRLGFRDQDLRNAGVEPPADPAQRLEALVSVNTRMLSAEREVALAELAAAGSQLRRVQVLLEETTIGCPIDGIVAARMLDPGERADTETLLFTVFDTSTVYAQAEVGERELIALAPGQEAIAVLAAGPSEELELRGRVELISPYVHPQTRTARVRVRLDNDGGRLVPGVFVRLRIFTAQPRSSLAVPLAALRGEPGDAAAAEVLLVRSGRVFRQPVRLEGREAELALVGEGLREGDLVVLDPPASLRDGVPVEVLP